MTKLGFFTGCATASIWMAFASASSAAELMVTSLDDSGSGTIRELIEAANANQGEDTIEFEPGLSGTILLQSALPMIEQDLQIVGPGAHRIAISGQQAHQLFEIDSGVSSSISGLTLKQGLAQEEQNGGLGLGGCVWNKGSLVLSEVIITACSAEVAGGGIANDGSLLLQQSTISGNTAIPEGFAVGGGVDNFGTARIEDSTVSGNVADTGGGIANSENAELTLINTTISENSAEFAGGGVDNFGGQVTVVFSSIVGNLGGFGGGVINEGFARIRNSLIADNPLGGDCDNQAGISFEVTGINLHTDGSCPGFEQFSSVQIGLEPLADNGGPTRTHALGADSIALELASDCTELDGMTPVATDQRGIARPQGDACDIGAFERALEDDEPADVIFADRFQAH